MRHNVTRQLECHGFVCDSPEEAILIAANLYQVSMSGKLNQIPLHILYFLVQSLIQVVIVVVFRRSFPRHGIWPRPVIILIGVLI